MSRQTSNQERWQLAPDFVVAGVHVPAVRCPHCDRPVVKSHRSMAVHASIACTALPSQEEGEVRA